MSCHDCEHYATCTQLCDEMRKKVHGGGKNRKRRTYPVDFVALEASSPSDLNRFQIEALAAVTSRPIDRVELRIFVEQVLSLLSEGQRFVFVKKMQGYTNHEIAQLVGLSDKAIEQRHTRAKKRIKRFLAQLNGGEAVGPA